MKLDDIFKGFFGFNQKGFTLVETMVAVGIGSIVTLGVTSMVQNAARLKIEAEAQIERNQLSFLFDSILIDTENCSLSILPVDPGQPDDFPIPAGRLYTNTISNTAVRRIPALRRYAANGTALEVIDLSSLPADPVRIGRSRIEITDVYLTNFKVLNTVEVYDPSSTSPDFVPRTTVKVPVSGTYDLVLKYNKIIVGAEGTAKVARKSYSVNKVVPVKFDQERPKETTDKEIYDDFTGRTYVSGCRTSEDISTAEVERYVCDSLGGGNEIRALVPNTAVTAPKWGPQPVPSPHTSSAGYSYVDCKDIKLVRTRMLKMLMCDELNGRWDPVTFTCENQFPAKGLNCPRAGSSIGGEMVVYGIYPDGIAINNSFEPLPSPPGDWQTEIMECRPPCSRTEDYPFTIPATAPLFADGVPCEI